MEAHIRAQLNGFNDPFYASIQNCETVIYQFECQKVQLKNIERLFLIGIDTKLYWLLSSLAFMHTRVTLRMALIHSGKLQHCSNTPVHSVHAFSHPI